MNQSIKQNILCSAICQTWNGHCAIVPWHRRPPPFDKKIPKVTYSKHNTNSNPKPNTNPNNKQK